MARDLGGELPTIVSVVPVNNPAGLFSGLGEQAFFNQRLFAVQLGA